MQLFISQMTGNSSMSDSSEGWLLELIQSFSDQFPPIALILLAFGFFLLSRVQGTPSEIFSQLGLSLHIAVRWVTRILVHLIRRILQIFLHLPGTVLTPPRWSSRALRHHRAVYYDCYQVRATETVVKDKVFFGIEIWEDDFFKRRRFVNCKFLYVTAHNQNWDGVVFDGCEFAFCEFHFVGYSTVRFEERSSRLFSVKFLCPSSSSYEEVNNVRFLFNRTYLLYCDFREYFSNRFASFVDTQFIATDVHRTRFDNCSFFGASISGGSFYFNFFSRADFRFLQFGGRATRERHRWYRHHSDYFSGLPAKLSTGDAAIRSISNYFVDCDFRCACIQDFWGYSCFYKCNFSQIELGHCGALSLCSSSCFESEFKVLSHKHYMDVLKREISQTLPRENAPKGYLDFHIGGIVPNLIIWGMGSFWNENPVFTSIALEVNKYPWCQLAELSWFYYWCTDWPSQNTLKWAQLSNEYSFQISLWVSKQRLSFVRFQNRIKIHNGFTNCKELVVDVSYIYESCFSQGVIYFCNKDLRIRQSSFPDTLVLVQYWYLLDIEGRLVDFTDSKICLRSVFHRKEFFSDVHIPSFLNESVLTQRFFGIFEESDSLGVKMIKFTKFLESKGAKGTETLIFVTEKYGEVTLAQYLANPLAYEDPILPDGFYHV
jgi:uncharacterized protein YjbI with pentapeptide repeats